MTDTLRSCIIAEQGYTFLSLDASQIELRVLAILSKDPQMLADLATGDLHLASAIRISQLRGEDQDWVTNPDKEAEKKKRRYDAKQCNFAIVYGAESFKLSQMMECTEEEAQQFMDEHRRAYPVLYAWMDAEKVIAKELGYVLTLFNRKRPLPELYAGSRSIREKAEREIVNTKIQGTAIDIVKLAMLYMRRILDKSIRLVLNVHDEMVFEVPDGLLEQALELSKELKEAFPDYPFKPQIGKVYGELKEYSYE
jgi:DNA polymerase-1